MRSVRKKLKIISWNIFRGIILLHILLFLLFVALSFYLIKNNPASSTLMAYREKYYSYKTEAVDFISINKIPDNVRNMFIAVEDPGFYSHRGIHIGAIINAYRLNRKLGYTRWGGSTITQQLARTLFLVPTKLYVRKYVEVLLALTMELILGKERILELYINYIEFGRGIYGLGNGTRHHYSKAYNELTDLEFIKLITILPNPLKYNPDNFYSERHLQRRYNILFRKFMD